MTSTSKCFIFQKREKKNTKNKYGAFVRPNKNRMYCTPSITATTCTYTNAENCFEIFGKLASDLIILKEAKEEEEEGEEGEGEREEEKEEEQSLIPEPKLKPTTSIVFAASKMWIH